MIRYEQNISAYNKITGSPIAYWLSSTILKTLDNNCLSTYSYNKAGVVSGDDNYFVRCWFEPLYSDICFTSKPYGEYGKYHIFCKGGDFRRYYGNVWHVIKLKDLYDEHCANKSIRRGDKDSYFRKGISWSIIGSSNVKSFRLIENSICGTASPSIYVENDDLFYYLLGLVNSKFSEIIINAINPTLNLQSSDVGAVPVIVNEKRIKDVDKFVDQNCDLCRTDWDSFETSWDFKKHPLI